jgi:hypothetical protein
MFGPDFALKHQVSQAQFRDLLAESERQHRIDLALAARPRMRHGRLVEARTIVASILRRAADWLMPDDAHAGTGQPAATLGLRPGR